MKKLFFLCALMPFLLVANEYTYYDYDSNCCNWLADTDLYVDWLYWKTRSNTFPLTNLTLLNREVTLNPEYQSGFRLGLCKEYECLDFEIRYTFFRPDANVSDIFEVDDQSVDAAIKWDLDYDQVDLIVGHKFYLSNCWTSHVFGGFTWTRLDYDIDDKLDISDDPEQTAIASNKMDAYGFNLGIDAHYQLWRCVNFFGAFWYNSLLANIDKESFVNTNLLFTSQAWEMISVLNLAFGFTYRYPICSCMIRDVALSIGYEFHHWINLPGYLVPQLSISPVGINNLDFDGLFIRCNFGF